MLFVPPIKSSGSYKLLRLFRSWQNNNINYEGYGFHFGHIEGFTLILDIHHISTVPQVNRIVKLCYI